MIKLNRLNNTEVFVNPDLIEMMEETPDLVITLKSGRKLVVSQKVSEVCNEIIDYKAKLAGFKQNV